MRILLILSFLLGSVLVASDEYAPLSINNWIYWQKSDGESVRDPGGWEGGFFPKETVSVIYYDAFVWGGKVQDPDPNKPQLRAGGQLYEIGTQAGWIETAGEAGTPPVAISTDDPRARIYRIRSDFGIASDAELLSDAAISFMKPKTNINAADIDSLRRIYMQDWQEWPAEQGAPYYDRDRNGVWDADFDEPGIVGADQLIWYVYNDLDATKTAALFGAPPIGLEVQVTVWAYKQISGALANTVFKRYKIINKSGFAIDSMYFGQHCELDIGDYGNDLNGCDSALNMGYTYNGRPTDSEFDMFNMAPPAVAYVVLQGPVITSNGSQAISDFKHLDDAVNLPLTSFWHKPVGTPLMDPALGIYGGTINVYGILQGYATVSADGYKRPMYHEAGPDMGKITFFPVNGDPVSGIGDVDGQGGNLPYGSRRFTISSGSFSMQPSDVQEFVLAIVGGLGNEHGDNIAAVADLQIKVPLLHQFYQGLTEFVAPQGSIEHLMYDDYLPQSIFFILGPGYPNPFNGYTNFRVQIFAEKEIKLEIWNTLGQRVKTIYRGTRGKGEQTFHWDGKNQQGVPVSSGIYLARMQSGAQIQWQKIVYLK